MPTRSTLADPVLERRRITSLLTTATMVLNANVAVSDVQVNWDLKVEIMSWNRFKRLKIWMLDLIPFKKEDEILTYSLFNSSPPKIYQSQKESSLPTIIFEGANC